VPLVLAISTTLGAQSGLLVRDRRGLEEARNLTTVVFDKTGTLTLGEHRVVGARVAGDLDENEVLRLAAAVEHDAEHPVGRAIVKSAQERNLDIPVAQALMASCDLTIATGGPPMVRAAYSSGKPAYGVGAGNATMVIDDSADVVEAAKNSAISKTNDHGSGCSADGWLMAPMAPRSSTRIRTSSSQRMPPWAWGVSNRARIAKGGCCGSAGVTRGW
jgi:cation transport ATPase